MKARSATPRARSVEEYYAIDEVRDRVMEYAGASGTAAPTAAYVATLPDRVDTFPTWDHPQRWPGQELSRLLRSGQDLARSLWDVRNLVVLLDLDYQNVEAPAEPFLHPADAFLNLEPTYRAVRRLLAALDAPATVVMTGRGYHFVGVVPLEHPVVDALAGLAPATPAWFAGYLARRPAGVHAEMSERQARASVGLGLLLEYAAHLVIAGAARTSLVPVVVNGTVVGRSLAGRACVSIDFSHAGDPLDVRHFRVMFGAYQWHRTRPDIFGEAASQLTPPLVALPRGRQSLLSMLLHGRGFDRASLVARRSHAVLPDIAAGIDRLLRRYLESSLAAFHREFHASGAHEADPPDLDLDALPPCISAALRQPNDLLLKPEHIQHLVRGLLARGWHARQIADLVCASYEADHQWGDRWSRLHPRTRAEFDVRVFAGLIATGLDDMVDFNCVSAREKSLCPGVGCPHDLRLDRERVFLRARR